MLNLFFSFFFSLILLGFVHAFQKIKCVLLVCIYINFSHYFFIAICFTFYAFESWFCFLISSLNIWFYLIFLSNLILILCSFNHFLDLFYFLISSFLILFHLFFIPDLIVILFITSCSIFFFNFGWFRILLCDFFMLAFYRLISVS
jgi:hypothetical protein